MSRISVVFLQAVIVLIGLVVLFFLIWAPLQEGRAANISVIEVYTDPFILYGYFTFSIFYAGLYQGIKLLSYISKNEVFSDHSVKVLRNIKWYSFAFCICFILAGVFIRLFHHIDDDPAGMIMICLITSFASFVVSTAAAIFEKLLQKAVDLKYENDLTV